MTEQPHIIAFPDPEPTPIAAPVYPITYVPVSQWDDTEAVIAKGLIDAAFSGHFNYQCEVKFRISPSAKFTSRSFTKALGKYEVVRQRTPALHPHLFDMLIAAPDWWAVVKVGVEGLYFEIVSATYEIGLAKCKKMRSTFLYRAPEDEPTTHFVVKGTKEYAQAHFTDVAWADVEKNYPQVTRDALSKLMAVTLENKEFSGGKIIVFHGPPGTGKTWAIRALLTEWKKWTDGVLIFDPDSTLREADQLIQFLDANAPDRTRLAIFEDADALLEKNGPRSSDIARMLSATDGLLGASKETIMLLSTNAPPQRLDTALLRPGRCIASIEFEPFPVNEANERLGGVRTTTVPLTLAEIYEKSTTVVTKIQQVEPTFDFGQYL